MPDLSRYLARIGYAGRPEPSLTTLETLALLHPQAIPFENLDPLLQRPVHLDDAALQDKLVDGGRGGYCFEHNLLLADVLRQIGFSVTQLAARVLWKAPQRVGPRSHMLLRVDLDDGPRIVDAGFGGITLTGVLRLDTPLDQATPHEPFRLRPGPEHSHIVDARVGNDWQPLYRFDQQPQQRVDYEVSSWFLCTHPSSPFVQVLMGARPFPGGRHALRDNVWTVYEQGHEARRTVLNRPDELRRVLVEELGIELPAGPKLDALLRELAGRSTP